MTDEWAFMLRTDWSWLFTTRALVIVGVPLLWLALATLIGRRLEGRRGW